MCFVDLYYLCCPLYLLECIVTQEQHWSVNLKLKEENKQLTCIKQANRRIDLIEPSAEATVFSVVYVLIE